MRLDMRTLNRPEIADETYVGARGDPLIGLQLTLNYDPAQLVFVVNDTDERDIPSVDNEFVPGTIIIRGSNFLAATGNLRAARLVFSRQPGVTAGSAITSALVANGAVASGRECVSDVVPIPVPYVFPVPTVPQSLVANANGPYTAEMGAFFWLSSTRVLEGTFTVP